MYSAILAMALTSGAETPAFLCRRCCEVVVCPQVCCASPCCIHLAAYVPDGYVYVPLGYPTGYWVWGPHGQGWVWYYPYPTYPVVPMHPNMVMWYRPELGGMQLGPMPPPPKMKEPEKKEEKKKDEPKKDKPKKEDKKVTLPARTERSLVTVKLPDGAKLLVNGQTAPQADAEPSGVQMFRTPALPAGTPFKYSFTIETVTNGKKATQSQDVQFVPGEPITLDFTGDKLAGAGK